MRQLFLKQNRLAAESDRIEEKQQRMMNSKIQNLRDIDTEESFFFNIPELLIEVESKKIV